MISTHGWWAGRWGCSPDEWKWGHCCHASTPKAQIREGEGWQGLDLMRNRSCWQTQIGENKMWFMNCRFTWTYINSIDPIHDPPLLVCNDGMSSCHVRWESIWKGAYFRSLHGLCPALYCNPDFKATTPQGKEHARADRIPKETQEITA